MSGADHRGGSDLASIPTYKARRAARRTRADLAALPGTRWQRLRARYQL